MEFKDQNSDIAAFIHFCFQKSKVDNICLSGKQCGDLWSQDIWLDKAEICLGMGLYQPARQLLAEAHLVAKVISF